MDLLIWNEANQQQQFPQHNYLCDAIKNQPAKGIFYLRFDSSGNAVVDFPKGQASFYSIDSNNSDQLYFMIGYPCAFLALMYKETKEKNT